eukprot:GFUD01011549.1.p1 GENE.GFUD01011549.1~~GFUD01011549.1.p1  ORF type:complete len:864 (-),score=141.42 GFUD01011549.1:346-2937(-)
MEVLQNNETSQDPKISVNDVNGFNSLSSVNDDRERKTRVDSQRSSISGFALEDDNDMLTQIDDVNNSFFTKGRDLQSTAVNHQYTEREKEILGSYDSQDYLPPHCTAYISWLGKQPARLDWDRWIMMGLIGFFTGVTGFFLHQIIDVIADTKWNIAKDFISADKREYGSAWITTSAYSSLFLVISAGIVVFLRPSAAGSGMPELIGFLNGTMIRHIFNLKTYVVKFFSCAFAVGAGMPIGPEGPMIHLGSMVGAGVSQFQSKTLGIKLPFFERFRNSEDRRNFISAGAAAGIASAFGAPVGGLLFAMEEVSSFWNMKLSWQVFFCSMVSAFTTDLFNSAFQGFKYTGSFGQFKTGKYILFQIEDGIDLNILGLIPSMILGILGGLFGSLFIFMNLKFARFRLKAMSYISNQKYIKMIRIMEPLTIMLITTTLSILIPAAFPCTPLACVLGLDDQNGEMVCQKNSGDGQSVSLVVAKPSVEKYTCPGNTTTFQNGTVLFNGSYNQAATLFFVTGEKAIQHLFSRNTHLEFDYAPLIIFFLFYFFLACWAAGTQISCGLVVPMLLIGALYGRILGRIAVDLFGVQNGSYWDWMDPGAFALLGGVSFFGGVTRLTMSLAVIMVEITNDIQFLLLIIVTILFAKWTGDFFTHSLYHSFLEFRCIPFLDAEPVLIKESGKAANLETHTAKEVMTTPVKTLREVENLGHVVDLLQNTIHGGFPVVSKEKTFDGLITRFELMTILCKAFTSRAFESGSELINIDIDYTEFNKMRGHKLSDPKLTKELLAQAQKSSERTDIKVDLRKYINRSAMSVPERFSLHRTYNIFRSLGLRHLTIVDNNFLVTGIITRKDLMGFSIEEKLLQRRMIT